MIKKILNGIIAQKQAERRAELYRNLMRHEAKIGGRLFGPVEPGARREFFCLDEHTWVWHEEWTDKQGQHQVRTTRYDVRPNGILKSQNGHYTPVSANEAKHLRDAVIMYDQRVKRELYPFVG